MVLKKYMKSKDLRDRIQYYTKFDNILLDFGLISINVD